ncbi:hypothetical protein ACKKBF_B30850 [Auxenochlorella protothecoides x Auxenochlorella symbiontica]
MCQGEMESTRQHGLQGTRSLLRNPYPDRQGKRQVRFASQTAYRPVSSRTVLPPLQPTTPMLDSRKNQDCIFYIQGTCNKGALCPFRHDQSKVQQHRAQQAQQDCIFFLQGWCSKGSLCPFRHDQAKADALKALNSSTAPSLQQVARAPPAAPSPAAPGPTLASAPAPTRQQVRLAPVPPAPQRTSLAAGLMGGRTSPVPAAASGDARRGGATSASGASAGGSAAPAPGPPRAPPTLAGRLGPRQGARDQGASPLPPRLQQRLGRERSGSGPDAPTGAASSLSDRLGSKRSSDGLVTMASRTGSVASPDARPAPKVVRESAAPARGPRQGAASLGPPSPERRRWATPTEAPGAPGSAHAAPSPPRDGAAGGRMGGGDASRREPAPAPEPVAPRPKTIEEIRAAKRAKQQSSVGSAPASAPAKPAGKPTQRVTPAVPAQQARKPAAPSAPPPAEQAAEPARTIPTPTVAKPASRGGETAGAEAPPPRKPENTSLQAAKVASDVAASTAPADADADDFLMLDEELEGLNEDLGDLVDEDFEAQMRALEDAAAG